MNRKITNTTLEHLVNPLGVAIQNPRFSWIANGKQVSYKITVCKDNDFGKIVWDSGEINASESNLIEYNGEKLESFGKYSWKVDVKFEDGTI